MVCHHFDPARIGLDQRDLSNVGCGRFPFVAASLAASRERYSKSIGEARLMIGNCIRMMARAPKSRAGCHFAAAIGLRSMLESFAPTIPDWANDQHTQAGPWSRSLPQGRRAVDPAADR